MSDGTNDLANNTDSALEAAGSPAANSAQSGPDMHLDKYNDPRVQITRRGILIGLGVLAFGIVGAAASVIGRKTRLEKSRAFWGDDTITAFQLGERLRMNSISGETFEPVELTGTPGLGHLRHALLDERNYDWTTEQKVGMSSVTKKESGYCVQLVITDPTAHRFEPVKIDIDLQGGWIGPSGGDSRVKSVKQAALKKFLGTLITVQQKHYDVRKHEGS